MIIDDNILNFVKYSQICLQIECTKLTLTCAFLNHHIIILAKFGITVSFIPQISRHAIFQVLFKLLVMNIIFFLISTILVG